MTFSPQLLEPRGVAGANGPDPDPQRELMALRQASTHNMRLLKAQIVPLIDAALRVTAQDGMGEALNGHRGRWTATALRLIDDTAILAAAGSDGGAMAAVDLAQLLRKAADWHAEQLGDVRIGAIPRLMARSGYMNLLVSELMTAISWMAPQEAPNGLRIGARRSGEAGLTVWTQDADLAPPDLPTIASAAKTQSDRCWSVAETLMRRMGGEFACCGDGSGRLQVFLTFPGDMVSVGADPADAGRG